MRSLQKCQSHERKGKSREQGEGDKKTKCNGQTGGILEQENIVEKTAGIQVRSVVQLIVLF